jgi:hypothetical protein
VWKDAYEACEAAQVMFLRKFGGAMRSRAGSAATMLEMLTRLASRLPTQTRRSEESEQYSNPRPAPECWRSLPNSPKRGSP